MNHHSNNTNALLVEIMIAVLFFALCTTALLQSFAAIHRQSTLSMVRTAAITEARSTLEQLNGSVSAEEAESVLTSAGYSRTGDAWTYRTDDCTYTAAIGQEAMSAGTLLTFTLDASAGETSLFSLDGAAYIPGEVQ